MRIEKIALNGFRNYEFGHGGVCAGDERYKRRERAGQDESIGERIYALHRAELSHAV